MQFRKFRRKGKNPGKSKIGHGWTRITKRIFTTEPQTPRKTKSKAKLEHTEVAENTEGLCLQGVAGVVAWRVNTASKRKGQELAGIRLVRCLSILFD